MKNLSKPLPTLLGKVMMILVLAAGVGLIVAGPARADDWQDHERQSREWREHHRHDHFDHHDHPVVVQQGPEVIFAPPTVVEEPADPPSGINLIFPLHFN